MLSLIRKDIRSSAFYLAGIVPVMALTSLPGLRSAQGFFWVTAIMSLLLVLTPPMVDWGAGADRLLHSLPVSRRDVVAARYAGSLLMSAIGVAICLGIAMLSSVVLAWFGLDWKLLVRPETALAFVLVGSGSIALLLPCIIRLGPAGCGLFASILLGGVFLMRALARPSRAAGQAVVAGGGSAHLAGGPAELVVVRTFDALGAPGGTVALLAACVLVLWISMKVSVWIHESSEF